MLRARFPPEGETKDSNTLDRSERVGGLIMFWRLTDYELGLFNYHDLRRLVGAHPPLGWVEKVVSLPPIFSPKFKKMSKRNLASPELSGAPRISEKFL